MKSTIEKEQFAIQFAMEMKNAGFTDPVEYSEYLKQNRLEKEGYTLEESVEYLDERLPKETTKKSATSKMTERKLRRLVEQGFIQSKEKTSNKHGLRFDRKVLDFYVEFYLKSNKELLDIIKDLRENGFGMSKEFAKVNSKFKEEIEELKKKNSKLVDKNDWLEEANQVGKENYHFVKKQNEELEQKNGELNMAMNKMSQKNAALQKKYEILAKVLEELKNNK